MSEMSNIKGIEQGRAKKAYDFAKDGNLIKQYDSYVKKVPMMIKTNGLGPTFAYIQSKDEKAYNLIYNQTKEWLKEKGLINGNTDLIKDIVTKDSSKYRLITNEVLALFTWLKRFVKDSEEAKKEKEDRNDNSEKSEK